MARLSDAQIRWFRLRRSGLVEPFATPEMTASTLAGVQAQILPAALGVAAAARRPGNPATGEGGGKVISLKPLPVTQNSGD